MKLRRLRIDRLPGINPGFTLEGIGDSVNVVVGPNASGKSSLMRALRASLYREESPQSSLSVEALFSDEQGELTATRLGRELSWQRAGQTVDAPPLPEHRFLPCYTLQVEDLLAVDGATDAQIAEQLNRELAGGYDVHAIQSKAPFTVTDTRARKADSALREAKKTLLSIQREQENLQQEEARLTRLREKRTDARAARDQLLAHEQALSLLEIQQQGQELERQLRAFPEHMDRLQGDELQKLDQLHRKHAELAAEQQRGRAEQQTARDQLQQSGLSDTKLEAVQLGDYRPLLQQLTQIESKVRQLQDQSPVLASESRRTQVALGATGDLPPHLDPDTLHRVEEALGEKRQLDAELRQTDAALQQLPDTSSSGPAPEILRQARQELLYWLAAPDHPQADRHLKSGIAILTVTALVAIAGSLLTSPYFAVLFAGTGLGLWLALRGMKTDQSERRTAESRFPSNAAATPAAWERPAVQECLQAIDRELLEAERQVTGLTRARELQRQRSDKQRALDTAHDQLAGLAREVGFDPEKLDASFERWLRLISDHDRARAAEESNRTALQEAESRMEALQQQLGDFLQQYQETPDSNNSEALANRLAHLGECISQRDQAREKLIRAEQDIEQLTHLLNNNSDSIHKLFQQALVEVNDEAALQQRIAQLDQWRAARRQLDDNRSVETDRRRALETHAALIALVDAEDRDALMEARDALAKSAEEYDTLVNDIARIESAINSARRQRALETARANEQQAREELSDALDEAMLAETGSLLLEQVSTEHIRESQPAALRQAANWFQRFTHHQFALEFDSKDKGGFAATETASGERRKLSELSSGTRMQLLLAVRIAFALQAERGREPLPLILDETLTTADPDRFRAAAESLLALARDDNRQIFYLTSQPGDIAYWQTADNAVNCIDLPAQRQQAEAISDASRFNLPEAHSVPQPAQQSAEDYAITLGVPAIDLWAPAEATPVFYLLRDNLPLLRKLLQAKLEKLGQLQSFLQSDSADVLLSKQEQALLKCRSAGASAWLTARRQGHGLPVDRAVLEEAPAVTDTQLDPVDELCRKVDGDAAALLEQLESGAVKYFKTNKRLKLQDWLVENGHLDSREPLDTSGIEQQMLPRISAFVTDGDAALLETQKLAASLENGIKDVQRNTL